MGLSVERERSAAQLVDGLLLLAVIPPAAQIRLNPGVENLVVKRLDDVIIPALLQSVWGKGYCFIDENPQAL